MAETKTIHQALAAAKAAVGAVSKAQRNTQQGFNFRGVDDVVNAAAGPLNEHGVIVTPDVDSFSYEVVEVGKNRTPMSHVVGLVKYTFSGPQGDSVTAKVLAESLDSGDKGAAKFMSVAYRIALLQVLNLPTDSPDPDAESYERSGNAQQETAKAPKSTARSTRQATEPQSSSPASSPEPATETDIAGFVRAIELAKNSTDLNKIWTLLGSKGALQAEIERDGTKVTLEKFLFARNDAIKSGSGN